MQEIKARRNDDSIARMKALACCILIPTYNNASALEKVILDCLNYCDDVLVINDGSTDTTDDILKRYSQLDIIRFNKNKGKGAALKAGFRHAYSKGFAYAITMDSDGQHLAEDIPLFLDRIEQEPGSLIVGARNLTAENMPKKNRFGNRFSNFWFRFETGIKLPDTQSGFRLYPLGTVGKIKYHTHRYDFEIEVMVRCAWKGINVTSVPVHVWYAPLSKQISHFKPVLDFTRISLLNTVLVFLAFLWVKPFRFIKALNRNNVNEFFTRHVLSPGESNGRKTLSVMVGTFIGIIPVWGWQIALAILVSVVFKLNRMMTIVASNISIPPMIPVLIYGSYMIGGIFIKTNTISLKYNSGITLEFISLNFVQYLVGSIVLAIGAALFFGLITFVMLSVFRKDSNNKHLAGLKSAVQKNL